MTKPQSPQTTQPLSKMQTVVFRDTPRRRTRSESPDQLIQRLRNAIRSALKQDEQSTGFQYDDAYAAGIKAALRAFDAARGQR